MNLCDRCHERPVAESGSDAWFYDCCEVCWQNMEEAAYENEQGECFRGGEAEAFYKEQHEKERRMK